MSDRSFLARFKHVYTVRINGKRLKMMVKRGWVSHPWGMVFVDVGVRLPSLYDGAARLTLGLGPLFF
jgi:hypothetical protein